MAIKPFFIEEGIEVGCDEAGRGCLAGPVYAAAVILPKDFHHPLLNDSKKINETNRDILRSIIEEEAISYAVAFCDPNEIDQLNILKASIHAMHKALSQLLITPTRILVDGNKFIPFENIEHHTIIKGDGKFASIAAASILAKTHRDEFMKKIHKDHPNYNWEKNKGYPTKEHRNAILDIGPCKHHRQSFQLYPPPSQGELF